jgi:hypothetical protein
MQMPFQVGGQCAEFHRNPVTGRAELRVGANLVSLQSPYRLSSQFSWGTRVAWRREVGGHDVEIVKVRPRFLGGFRSNSYSISVDDLLVAQAAGI